jgi:hypothetical protein
MIHLTDTDIIFINYGRIHLMYIDITCNPKQKKLMVCHCALYVQKLSQKSFHVWHKCILIKKNHICRGSENSNFICIFCKHILKQICKKIWSNAKFAL